MAASSTVEVQTGVADVAFESEDLCDPWNGAATASTPTRKAIDFTLIS